MEDSAKEVDKMIEERKLVDLETEKKQAFWDGYKALVKEYGYDFYQEAPKLVKVQFERPPVKTTNLN